MSDLYAALEIRAKMIGVLLRDARQAKGHTLKECAEVIGGTSGLYNAYEQGAKSPSLPELELLAYYLELPIDYFWGNQALSAKPTERAPVPPPEMHEIRDRIIGAEIRQARLNAQLTLKELASELGFPSSRLSSYEFGEKPIPLPELEVIANRLGMALEDLLEKTGTIGEWDSLRRAFERFRKLPPDLREFVTQPVNEHYLRLAHALSQMPAEKLRTVASSLLDITY